MDTFMCRLWMNISKNEKQDIIRNMFYNKFPHRYKHTIHQDNKIYCEFWIFLELTV